MKLTEAQDVIARAVIDEASELSVSIPSLISATGDFFLVEATGAVEIMRDGQPGDSHADERAEGYASLLMAVANVSRGIVSEVSAANTLHARKLDRQDRHGALVRLVSDVASCYYQEQHGVSPAAARGQLRAFQNYIAVLWAYLDRQSLSFTGQETGDLLTVFLRANFSAAAIEDVLGSGDSEVDRG